jgi:hypothetical protein
MTMRLAARLCAPVLLLGLFLGLVPSPAACGASPAVEPAAAAPGLPSAEAPPGEAALPSDPLAACLPTRGRKRAIEYEFCLLRHEKVGELAIGVGEKDALAAVSCPLTRGKETFLAATGDYGQKWAFPACGVELQMVSSGKGGPKVISSIVVSAPSTLTTTKGIRIGSAEEEVLAAYGPFIDKGASRRGKTIIAGSIYGGLILSLSQGKVDEIFLGAGAE